MREDLWNQSGLGLSQIGRCMNPHISGLEGAEAFCISDFMRAE
jgi:hypothetical protein